MIKTDKHCVSLAGASDRRSRFWKSFGTLDIWLDCSFHAHLLCALSSALHQCTYCSFHRKLSLQKTSCQNAFKLKIKLIKERVNLYWDFKLSLVGNLVQIMQDTHVLLTGGVVLEHFLTNLTLNLCVVVNISHVPSEIYHSLVTHLTPVVPS